MLSRKALQLWQRFLEVARFTSRIDHSRACLHLISCRFKFLDRERKVAMATALLATILGCAATWFEVLATTGTGDITLELTAWGTATSRFDDDTNGGGQVQPRGFFISEAHANEKKKKKKKKREEEFILALG